MAFNMKKVVFNMIRKTPRLKFVNLHAHDVAGSPFDALGYPKDHFDFCYENGMDAMALTNHGNMNSHAYALLHAREMNKQGKKFKYIAGVEAYYIDDVIEWRKEYEIAKEDKKRKKELKEEDGMVFEEENRQLQGTIRGNAHFLLLAKNQLGLNNLFEMLSTSNALDNDYFFRKPRIDFELLKKYSKGLIATTTCISGVFAKIIWSNPEASREELKNLMRPYLEKFISVFGKENYFVELQWNAIPEQHILNLCKIDLAKEYGLKLISTVDSHYARPELWKQRELYKRLAFLNRTKVPDWISEEIPESVEDVGYELYPKNGDQMFVDYVKYSKRMGYYEEYSDEEIIESIENTYYIAHELIEDFEPDCSVRLPEFVVPDGIDADEQLHLECSLGAMRKNLHYADRHNHPNMVYINRVEEELRIIKKRGFAKYFLTMKKIVDMGHENMLVGPARGSAAGSLVAYLLNITQIDPIKWDLQFSRFLREDDTGYPDIDVDFARTDEMKAMLIEKWGNDIVAPISNWNTLQLKSLIKDIAKFYDINFEHVNNVTKKMIREATNPAKKKHGIKAGVYVPTWEEVMEFSPTLQEFLEEYPEVAEHVKVLVGQVRSCGKHAGGLVVGENIQRNLPLIRSKGIMQVPFSEGQNVRHLEPLGFIKFDVLGLESLALIEGTIKRILKRHHDVKNPQHEDVLQYYNTYLHPEKIDHDDQNVYKNVYHQGKFLGVFQFTQKNAQNFCMQAKPKSLVDIAAITSLYRPGPLSSNMHKTYTEAKKLPHTVTYPCKEYKEATKETYGLCIFQEQISAIAANMSDYISADDSQKLRKLLTKKEKGGVKNLEGIEDEFVKKMIMRDFSRSNAEKLKVYYEAFVKGSVEKGVAENVAEKIWNTLEEFAGYGFNKSHAVAYSFVSFQCAWLMNYYPQEWVCTYLDHAKQEKKEEAISIAKRFGFKLVKHDINTSGDSWEISGEYELRPPLTSIKGLGEKAVEEIVHNRPFNNLEELLFHPNVVYRKLNKKALSVLARSGALDSIKDERIKNRRQLWMVVTEKPKKLEDYNASILFYQNHGDFNIEEEIENAIELTGQYPFDIVLDPEMKQRLREFNIPAISEYSGQEFVWFIVRENIVKRTTTGKDYWIVKTIDSEGGQVDVKVWGVSRNDVIHPNRLIIAKVDHSDQWGFSIRKLSKSIRYLD